MSKTFDNGIFVLFLLRLKCLERALEADNKCNHWFFSIDRGGAITWRWEFLWHYSHWFIISSCYLYIPILIVFLHQCKYYIMIFSIFSDLYLSLWLVNCNNSSNLYNKYEVILNIFSLKYLDRPRIRESSHISSWKTVTWRSQRTR